MMNEADLFPDLQMWNGGNGIDVKSWLTIMSSSDLALAYLQVFWPTFIRIDNYILRPGLKKSNISHWEKSGKYDRSTIEKVLNNIDMMDQFCLNSKKDDEAVDIKRCQEIVKIIHNIYKIKLQLDFPDILFEVSVSGLDQSDDYKPICISFWQI